MNANLVKFGEPRCVADAVLRVVAKQHLDHVSVDISLTADAEVQRSQSVVIHTVHRRAQV